MVADSGGSTTKYILIGCAIALGLGVCGVGSCLVFVGGGAFWAYEQMDEPAREARAFVLALGEGNAAAALEHASKSFRARVGEQALLRAIEPYPALNHPRDVTLSQRSVNDAGARMAGTVSGQGAQLGIDVRLVREGELWRVDDVFVAGVRLVP